MKKMIVFAALYAVGFTALSDGFPVISNKANVITPKMSVEAANKKLLRKVDKNGVPKALADERERRAAEKENGTVEVIREVRSGGSL